ncbi:hypothetical protein MMC10_009968 [Thelotrema lepadinum]|nr:hypothetical protein [Thelotrema lepadinum]
MKLTHPIVSAFNAWTCIVVSCFAILILTPIGALFQRSHYSFVGAEEDPSPEQAQAVAGTIFTAVIVYAAFLVFCGLQALLHVREGRRGSVRLN